MSVSVSSPRQEPQLFGGVYPAKVYAVSDPLLQGRIQMYIPQVFGDLPVKIWAPPVSQVSSVPAVGSVVWCLFQGGDPAYPTYLPPQAGGGGGGDCEILGGLNESYWTNFATYPLDGTQEQIIFGATIPVSGTAPSWIDATTGQVLEPGLYVSSLFLRPASGHNPSTTGLRVGRNGPWYFSDWASIDDMFVNGLGIQCFDTFSIASSDIGNSYVRVEWDFTSNHADATGQVQAQVGVWRLITDCHGTGGSGGGGGTQTLGFHYSQASAATTWVINHGLSFYPNVSVQDSTGHEIYPGDIQYTSATQVTLTFSAAVGGDAYLS